jgi:hypothetical protein
MSSSRCAARAARSSAASRAARSALACRRAPARRHAHGAQPLRAPAQPPTRRRAGAAGEDERKTLCVSTRNSSMGASTRNSSPIST